MLSKEAVKNIAKLARLGISETETNRFARELGAILEFFEKLKEVDVEGVEPTAQVTGLHSVARPDEAVRRSAASREKLLDNAPDKKDNYIKVKAVFE